MKCDQNQVLLDFSQTGDLHNLVSYFSTLVLIDMPSNVVLDPTGSFDFIILPV